MAEAGDKVFVHLIVHDPQGPIVTPTSRLRVACTPDSAMPYSATILASAVSCPGCIESQIFAQVADEQAPGSKADRAARKRASEDSEKTNETTKPDTLNIGG